MIGLVIVPERLVRKRGAPIKLSDEDLVAIDDWRFFKQQCAYRAWMIIAMPARAITMAVVQPR